MPTSSGSAPTPYIPNTDADREVMLGHLGVTDIESLFDELPAALRDPQITLPPPLAEAELIRLRLADPAQLDTLLTAEAYRAHVASEHGS